MDQSRLHWFTGVVVFAGADITRTVDSIDPTDTILTTVAHIRTIPTVTTPTILIVLPGMCTRSDRFL